MSTAGGQRVPLVFDNGAFGDLSPSIGFQAFLGAVAVARLGAAAPIFWYRAGAGVRGERSVRLDLRHR